MAATGNSIGGTPGMTFTVNGWQPNTANIAPTGSLTMGGGPSSTSTAPTDTLTLGRTSLAIPGAASGGGAPLPAAQDATLQATVSSILGLQSTAVTDAANATAANTSATGYEAEGGAYQTAADIATQNATVAGIGGTVKALQEQRATNVTIGAQKAGVAAAGFGAAGTSLDLLRSSMQQGYVTQQLTGIQTQLTKGGYIEEAAASAAEKAAAEGTAGAARATAASDTTAANMARATAASETAALNNFLGSYTLTADQSLLLSPLAAANSIANGGTGAPTGPSLLDTARNGPAATAASSPLFGGAFHGTQPGTISVPTYAEIALGV